MATENHRHGGLSRRFRPIGSVFALLAVSAAGLAAPAEAPARAEGAAPAGAPRAAHLALPMRFEPNVGQTDADVRYLARGAGYTLFLTPDETVLALRGAGDGRVLRMALAGRSATASVEGEGELPGATSYLSADASRWRSGVCGYERVRYAGVYPGVDAVFYGNQRELEYDFVVAPGADPGAIRLAFSGADAIPVDGAGALELTLGGATIVQRPPAVYQLAAGERRRVAARYTVDGDEVGFAIAGYDSTLPLVIDPVLSYSTYLGGSGVDEALGIAVDGDGSVYVTGATTSPDFPRQFAIPIENRGSDAFVTKLNPAGTGLVYSTYLGGSGEERGLAIAIDGAGSAYVAGSTTSPDFPVTGTGLTRRGAGQDVFLSKLSADGRTLAYSAAFGGGNDDFALAVAVDAAASAYVTGSTSSSDFPTQFPIQISSGEGNEDAFIAKVNAAGTAFQYSTYLGGSGRETGRGIVVDAGGAATVTGGTNSENFPVRRPTQNELAGARDAFVTTISPTGTELTISTFLGGMFNDAAFAVAIGPDGALYLTGQTASDDFPTKDPVQANAGGGDAFLTKLNAADFAIVYSTFLGGSGSDEGFAIAVDPTGSPYVAGITASADYPTRLPLQTDTNDANTDAFVTKLATVGTRISYSTYFGGAGADRADAIAVDASGNAYIAGTTLSTNLPVQNPIVTDRAAEDGFVTKIGDAFADLSLALAATPEPVRGNELITYTATVANAGPDSAGNVVFSMTTPVGTVFDSAESSQGSCTTPAAGAAGEVRCQIGTLGPGATATVTVALRVTAPEGSTLSATATVGSTAADTNAANDTASVSSSVIEPVDPPVVVSIRALTVPGKAFRIRIEGANLQTGAQVFIGDDTTPWPTVKYKSPSRIVLKKGKPLRDRFPKGVEVTIRVVNPDGGVATSTFTR